MKKLQQSSTRDVSPLQVPHSHNAGYAIEKTQTGQDPDNSSYTVKPPLILLASTPNKNQLFSASINATM
jgi:hypothetical protein